MQNFAVSSLAFLSRDRSRFVPELRWYPRSSQADSLVSGLLAGPSDWLAKGASSLIPRNAERAGRGVVVEGGTATVHLSADSDPASGDVRDDQAPQAGAGETGGTTGGTTAGLDATVEQKRPDHPEPGGPPSATEEAAHR